MSGTALFGSESERLELLVPFSRQIAQPLDADAAGQATFHGSFDKIGRWYLATVIMTLWM